MDVAQLQAQAGAEHYTRAVKLRLGGCLASDAELANYSQGSSRVTRRKLQAVNALASAMRTVINGFIRCLYENCLNVSSDLREPSDTEKPPQKPLLKFGLDAWTLDFLRDCVQQRVLSNGEFFNAYQALSERAKSQCLKEALQVLRSVDNSKKERTYQTARGRRLAKCPVLGPDAAIALDAKFAKLSLARRGEVKMKHFDVALHLSVIGGKRGTPRMVIPLKGTKVLNKWLDQPGADLLDSVCLTRNAVIVYVRVPVQPLLSKDKAARGTPFKSYRHKLLSRIEGTLDSVPAVSPALRAQTSTGSSGCSAADPSTIKRTEVFALDLGINKPFVLTNLEKVSSEDPNPSKLIDVDLIGSLPPQEEFSAFFGAAWQRALLDKRLRKKRGSKAFKRASTEHRQLIDYELNRLPFERMKILVIENLTNIKKYKTNKKVLLWLVAYLVKRITAKCEEHRVLVDFVYPAYTSQTCPYCRIVKAANRVAESYRCSCSGFPRNPLDADFVGAYNVRRRFLESVKWYSPSTPAKHKHVPPKGIGAGA